MDDLENFILRTVERFMSGRHHGRMGIVTSYDPDNHAAKVTLQPEGIETGWLPVHGSHIGNGWGMIAGLQVGDQVGVTPQEGDHEALAITSRIHSEEDKPPRVESGEMLLRHQSGAQIKFGKDDAIAITHADGSTVTFDKEGTVTMKSKKVVVQSGDISFTAA